jgi:hypothetical protein
MRTSPFDAQAARFSLTVFLLAGSSLTVLSLTAF